ncbi:MAG TPA: hypothetical protein VL333_01110 [Candidatus Saccharimonadales bacterium]|jgi:hypothetical protein|nr:hypothetical protein [Candidatus Saccharimonadales bacterium]
MAHAVVSDRTPLKTIVGIFSNDRKAVEAMRSLDAAGFDAGRVQMTGDDPSRAAEAGGKTYALEGGILGLAAGAVVVAGFAAWGNLATNPVGLAIGAVGVIGGMAAIGFVIGRTSGRHSPDAHLFSRVVQNGGAIVSVQCSERECELAAQVLDGAGAREVRDEAGPEAV